MVLRVGSSPPLYWWNSRCLIARRVPPIGPKRRLLRRGSGVVQPRLLGGRGDDGSLVLRDFEESRADLLWIEEVHCEIDVCLMMTRLAGEEALVELEERPIGGALQCF